MDVCWVLRTLREWAAEVAPHITLRGEVPAFLSRLPHVTFPETQRFLNASGPQGVLSNATETLYLDFKVKFQSKQVTDTSPMLAANQQTQM